MRFEQLVIRRITSVGRHVKHFEFSPADTTRPLRPHAPGAHVVVATPVQANPYSLTGDGVRPQTYAISVRRVHAGGGSGWLHDHARVGDRIDVSAPTSTFAPVPSARHHLLVAAGIGVTPILSHARAAVRWRRSFEIVYGHGAEPAPHRDELAALAPAGGFTDAVGRTATMDALNSALRRQPVGTHLYACGPAPMLMALRATASDCGWPDQRVHVEYFARPDAASGAPFTMQLAGRDLAVHVPAGISALHALDRVGVRLPRSCERGVCGRCRTGVTGGVPEHRDLILSEDDRAANDWFYPCVSRASTAFLEVTLP